MFGNFFELIGRWLFQKKRTPFFFASLSIGPLICAIVLYLEKQTFQELEETSSGAMSRVRSAFHRKAKKDAFFAKHGHSDPYFLDKEIESLCFLNREKNQLKGWLQHPAIQAKETLLRRMQFLENGGNRLSFAEEEIQISKTCKETMEKQRSPIEVDADDLQKLLSKIEEIPGVETAQDGIVAKGRPQLLICNFSMTKKNTSLQNEVFEITIDLLKREFLNQ